MQKYRGAETVKIVDFWDPHYNYKNWFHVKSETQKIDNFIGIEINFEFWLISEDQNETF